MRRTSHNHFKKAGTGKLVTGLLLGSVVGATLGWLIAPVTGAELRRRLMGKKLSTREKIQTSEGNIESQARALAAEVGHQGNI